MADLDGNGMVDLLGSPESIDRFGETDYYGLAVWRLDASGGVARHSLLDWKAFIAHAATRQRPQRRWRAGCGYGRWQLEHRSSGSIDVARPAQRRTRSSKATTPCPARGNQVLTGDVNGDGDTDLVVLGTNPASGLGGVFVLINQGTPATAIAARGGHAKDLWL